MSKTMLWVIVIALLLVIFAGGVYLWVKLDSLSSQLNEQASQEESVQEEPQMPAELPEDTVDGFTTSTLGTLPGADLDLDLAKSMMTDQLASQYSGNNWVSEFYGIQDGPESFVTTHANATNENATVKVTPTFGDMGASWVFSLANVGGKWKVDEFRNDGQ